MSDTLDLTAPCPCGSGATFGNCCEPVIGGAQAPTAEVLMRSRYTAFTLLDASYLRYSWHPDTRPGAIEFDTQQRWLGLRIKSRQAGMVGDERGEVCFAARYKIGGRGYRLEECSRFVRICCAADGLAEVAQPRWVYVDGDLA